MFGKKKKQVLLWDVIDKKYDTPITDYLIPTKQLQPKWYKNLKQVVDPRSGVGNVKSCPSFQQLFQDSYTFVSPCDFEIEVGRQGHRILQANSIWWKIDSHTNIQNHPSQMGLEWDKDLYNVKFGPNILISTNVGKLTVMSLPPFYYNPRSEIIIPPGVFDITPSINMQLNLNTFIDLKGMSVTDSKTIKIKAGQPLAMLYLPQGTLDLERTTLHSQPRKKFFGDYKEKLKKCPYH